jgi:glycosyltransferase involved in cell wall biosynthesis
MTLAPLSLTPLGLGVLDVPAEEAARRRRDRRARATGADARVDVIDLSVVVPAHNEELRLPATLAAIRADLAERPERCEMIVVDDGSTDGTADVAGALGANLVRLPVNLGKGAAVRAGVSAARGRYILVSDADLSTPIAEYANLRRAIDEGASVAIGSRAVAGARITQGQPLHRRAMGRVFNRLVQVLLLPGVQDTQCGFKLFRADAAQAAFGRSTVDGFAFDVEVLSIIHRLGGRIAEVPVEWHDEPRSTVRPFRDVPEMLLELIRIRRGIRRPASDATRG